MSGFGEVKNLTNGDQIASLEKHDSFAHLDYEHYHLIRDTGGSKTFSDYTRNGLNYSLFKNIALLFHLSTEKIPN